MLGPESFALWSFAYVIVNYGALFDLGLSGALARSLGCVDPETDGHAASSYIVAAFTCIAGYGALIAILLCMAPYWARIFTANTKYLDVLPWIGPMVVTALLNNLANFSLLGIHRQDLSSYTGAVLNILTGFGNVIVLAFGGDLRDVLIFTALTAGAMTLVGMRLLYHRIPGKISFAFSGPCARELFRFGLPLQLYSFAGMFYMFIGKGILGFCTSLSGVTEFELGLRPVVLVRQGLSSLVSPLLPASARLSSSSASHAMTGLFLVAMKYVSLASLPVCCALLIFPDVIVTAWLGQRHPTSEVVLALLAPGCYAGIISAAVFYFLVGSGEPLGGAKIALAEALFGSALTFALGLRFGLAGGAVAATVPACIVSFFYLRMFHRIAHYPWPELLSGSFLRPGIVCGLSGALARYAFHFVPAFAGPMIVALFLATSYSAYFAIGLIDRSERQDIMDFARTLFFRPV
jgi:O-antigen/teichoic acid export membrane protein